MSVNKVLNFVNPYKKANTYIIELNEFDILIIDLGNYSITKLVEWITLHKKNVRGLLLTHEHADHCYGVDSLRSRIEFTLFCSEKCEVNMRNPIQNLSRYIEEFETFGVQTEATIIKEGQVINFDGFYITVMETPGHSPGSICLLANNIVFTGDTLLNGVESPLSFPHSDKKEYQISKNRLLDTLTPQIKIYPGHGVPFNSVI
jgi:hydroxyacylglutathione hydrolase